MNRLIRGRVLRVGDSVNTDIIAPGRWKLEGMEVLKKHTMEALYPDFYKLAKEGDILVAGRDFGCGSHREQAVSVFQSLGIQALVAESIARLYLRNSICFGFPAFTAEGIAGLCETGDVLAIEITDDAIIFTNETKKTKLMTPMLPQEMWNICSAGGILSYLKEQLSKEE